MASRLGLQNSFFYNDSCNGDPSYVWVAAGVWFDSTHSKLAISAEYVPCGALKCFLSQGLQQENWRREKWLINSKVRSFLKHGRYLLDREAAETPAGRHLSSPSFACLCGEHPHLRFPTIPLAPDISLALNPSIPLVVNVALPWFMPAFGPAPDFSPFPASTLSLQPRVLGTLASWIGYKGFRAACLRAISIKCVPVSVALPGMEMDRSNS